jgi:hypothetical protein
VLDPAVNRRKMQIPHPLARVRGADQRLPPLRVQAEHASERLLRPPEGGRYKFNGLCVATVPLSLKERAFAAEGKKPARRRR